MWTDQGWVPPSEQSADEIEPNQQPAEGPEVQERLQEEISLCRNRLEALEVRLRQSRSLEQQPVRKRSQVTELREAPILPQIASGTDAEPTWAARIDPEQYQTPKQVFVEPPPRRGLLSPAVSRAPAEAQQPASSSETPLPLKDSRTERGVTPMYHEQRGVSRTRSATSTPTPSTVLNNSEGDPRNTNSPRPAATTSDAVELVTVQGTASAPRRGTPEPQKATIPSTPAIDLLRNQRDTLKQELHRVRLERKQLQAIQVKFTASTSELRHLWKTRDEAEEQSHQALLATLNRLTLAGGLGAGGLGETTVPLL